MLRYLQLDHFVDFFWLEIKNMPEKTRPWTDNFDRDKNGNGKGLEFQGLCMGMSG